MQLLCSEDMNSRAGMQALHSHDGQPVGYLIRKAHSTVHEGSTVLGDTQVVST